MACALCRKGCLHRWLRSINRPYRRLVSRQSYACRRAWKGDRGRSVRRHEESKMKRVELPQFIRMNDEYWLVIPGPVPPSVPGHGRPRPRCIHFLSPSSRSKLILLRYIQYTCWLHYIDTEYKHLELRHRVLAAIFHKRDVDTGPPE